MIVVDTSSWIEWLTDSPVGQRIEAQTEQQAASEAVAQQASAPTKEVALTKIRLPAETKETPLYLITPQMGQRPRWFEKRRLASYQLVDGVWEIELPASEVKARKIAVAA